MACQHDHSSCLNYIYMCSLKNSLHLFVIIKTGVGLAISTVVAPTDQIMT